MTRVTLLEQLSDFTEKHVSDLLLPVQMQEEDEEEPPFRAPSVYFPCLPELRLYAQYAPFITHEIVTGQDGVEQTVPGVKQKRSSAVVRTCFCVYHKNQQEGRLSLLTLMERIRIPLLDECVNQTAVSPFYLGEMITTWKLPTIERKVSNESQQADYRGSGYPAR